MKKCFQFLTLLQILCNFSYADIKRVPNNNDLVEGIFEIRGYDKDRVDRNKHLRAICLDDRGTDGPLLNIKMFELSGTREISNAVLNWKIITSEYVDYFEIERSINNGIYITIAAIHQSVYLNELQTLNFTDNIYGIVAEKLVYRVKIISKSKKIKYSNVSTIYRNKLKRQLSIVPNQAKDYVNISFFSAKDATAQICVLDSAGNKVYLQNQPAYKGNNTVKLINLNNYNEGQYVVQIILNGDVTSGKLILLTSL
jgi:hypothetical protein